MDNFEYKGGKLYHARADQLLAVVDAEHVAAYREFIPDAPLPEVQDSEPADQ